MIHITDLTQSLPLFKALSSDIRLKIIKLLANDSQLNMNDLAEKLNLTNGSITMHVKKLEECGLIKINTVTAKHGIQKICNLHEDKFVIEIAKPIVSDSYELDIGVGHYSAFEVFPTCGIATKDKIIGEVDNPNYFDDPERMNSGILWFSKGFVEYRIPNYIKPNQIFKEIQISMEISSEAPGNNSNWPSDINFFLNGRKVGDWTSPGDFADAKGFLTPDWWFSVWNQYGLLKLLTINHFGTFIDGLQVSDITIDDIELDYRSNLVLKLAVPETAKHVGGLTIFGKNFGNYNQGIHVRVIYKEIEKH